MSDDQRIRRSTIIALAICFVFFGSIVAYYALRPRQATATALFSVSSQPIKTLDDGKPFDPREFEIIQRTQEAYLKSYFVVQSALRAPGMEALAILAPHDDKVQWLIDNVDAKFYDNSEILSISLTGPADHGQDLKMLVDALSDAYLKVAVFEEEQMRLVVGDAKRAAFAQLAKELEELGQKVHALRGDSPEEKAVRDVAQSQYEALDDLYRELHRELELDEIQSVTPSRIRRVQKATLETLPKWSWP